MAATPSWLGVLAVLGAICIVSAHTTAEQILKLRENVDHIVLFMQGEDVFKGAPDCILFYCREPAVLPTSAFCNAQKIVRLITTTAHSLVCEASTIVSLCP